MSQEPPPSWRLPTGVNASLWRYTHSDRLAEDEDDYFVGNPLHDNDAYWIDERFQPPGRVVDLGCGVGRHAIRMAALGWDVTAVDLSVPMLRTVGAKARERGLTVDRVAANLCDLRCFPDGSFDLALSMFSTWGMIRGIEARRRALGETARILAPGGRLVLHAHNLWLNLRVPGARIWLAESLLAALRGDPDAGDRRMTYRGVNEMEVHLFRWGELQAEFRRAGLVIDEFLPIHERSAEPIRAPWLLQGIRAGGWVVFARKRD
ncbi:MAG: class I SAM-dependent methyltransferase [Isosphaeraceae bacterium]|nr:class I SAM-dependent methyltransferase [Isosphaeraceae bacterium]